MGLTSDILSGIKNISRRQIFKAVWQFLNLRYLYHLLYPYIAKEFRHQDDCNACVLMVATHTHIVCCAKCGFPSTFMPTIPPIVTPILGLAHISPIPDIVSLNPIRQTDLDFPFLSIPGLMAGIGVATTQGFDPSSIINLGKGNIGLEDNPLTSEMEDALKPSKWFD